MRSRLPTSTAVNPTELQIDSWLNVDFDWGDSSVEPSRLAAGGFNTELGVTDEVFATSLHPTLIHYSDDERGMHDPAGYIADQIGLPSPLTMFDTSTSTTPAASTGAATTNTAGHNMSETFGMPINSSYASERHAITISADLSSDKNRTNEYQEHPADLAFWADKIMPLFVELTQHLQSIPRVNLDNTHHDHSNGEIPSPSRSHNPDRTFELSESFINILSGMCSKLPPTDACATTGEGRATKYRILDEASYLLIFSTYLRFLEMHDTVFRYLLACLSQKHESSAAGTCFYLPKLILGSFSLAMTSETRPLLFVNLMESMLDRAKPLFHRLASVKTYPAASDKDCGPFAGLTPVLEPTMALESIRARETSIVRLVKRIKAMLSQPKSFKT
jgi:hypothetical protein